MTRWIDYKLIDYLFIVAIAIAIFHIFSDINKWFHFFFLLLFGLRYLLRDMEREKKIKNES
ncbi:hypothetical protein LCGC14_2801740 [marine sediment metagenome]|uniref:Uncharacterized protein n=1 Tax=marine sediment metagenome TaxID=412755 RepID=A0A0F8Z9E6_9ZZZZ